MRLRFKIAFNTLIQILGKIISASCTFLVTVLVARRFGITGFGEFVKITTYVSLFYLIVDFGLNAVVLREIESAKRKAQNYFINLLSLRVVYALILIFLALAVLAFLPFNPLTLEGFTPLSKLGIIILAPTILFQAIFVSANAVFQKNLRYDLSVLASSLGSFGTLGLIILLLKSNAPLLLVVTSYLVGGLIMAGLALVLANFQFVFAYGEKLLPNSIFNSQSIFNFQFSIWKKLFFRSLPLGLTLIFNLIYFKADALILSVFRPTSEVGIYGLAKSFFEFPLAVPTFFMNAVYPILLGNTQHATRNTLIKKSAIFLIISSLLLSAICYLLSPYLVLIKSDFADSVLIFRILSAYLPIFFLSSLFMWTLIALGKQKLLVLIYGKVMIINLLLNLFLIPRFGYLAATIILGMSELMVLGLTGGFCLEFLRKEENES